MAQPASVLQLRIELLGIEPLIWLRIQVPDTYTFWDLHVAIQSAFGWNDTHLHQFELHDSQNRVANRFGIPFDDDLDVGVGPELQAGWQYRVSEFLAPNHCTALYCYDFGDNWRHEITLEQVLTPAPGKQYPRCTDGERAGPPDDCGGTGGYTELLAILADPSHEDNASSHRWAASIKGLRRRFDPDAFDEQQVKFDNPARRLKHMLQDGG